VVAKELGTLDNLLWRGLLIQQRAADDKLSACRLADTARSEQRSFSRWRSLLRGSPVYVALPKGFSILFSIGHTFSGENQSVAYIALGWTGSLHKVPGLQNALTPVTLPNGTLPVAASGAQAIP